MDTLVDDRVRREAAVRRAFGWGATFRVFSAVCSFLVVPFASRTLPSGEFELWLVLWSLVAVIAPLDLGLGSALTSRAAALFAGGDRRAAAGALGTATGALLAVGVVVGGAGVVAAVWFGATALLGSGADVPASTSAVVLLVGLVAVNLPLSAAPRYLQGAQRSDDVAKVGLVANAVQVGAAAVAWAIGAGLVWFVVVALSATLLSNAGCWLLLAGDARLASWRIDRPELRTMLGSARWFWGLSLVVGLAFETDALVVAHVQGVEAAAEFALPARLFLFVPGVLSLAAAGFWPAVAESRARGDHQWGLDAVRRMAIRAGLAGTTCGIGLAVVLPLVLRVVASDAPTPSVGLVMALVAAVAVHSASVPVAGYMSGAGLLRQEFAIAGTMAVANVVLSIVGAHLIGLAGPPLATALTQGVTLVASVRVIHREGRA